MSHHMNMNVKPKSRARKVVSYVFSFFLALDTMAIALLVVLNMGLFSERSLISALDETYYTYVKDYIETQAEYYTLPTGIKASVLDEVFTLEDIQINTNRIITNSINGNSFTPDVSKEREKLLANVKASFATDGVETAEGTEADAVADSYVDEIMKIYTDALKIPGIDAISNVQNGFSKAFPIALVALILLAVAFVLIIVRLHHYLHRSLRYVAYACGGASLMLLVVPAIIQVSGFYYGLHLEPQYFYYFVVSMIERILRLTLIAGAVMAAASVVVALICGALRQDVSSGHRRS